MKNFVQPGEVIEYTNATGNPIASGDVVVVDGKVGVACGDIADTEKGSVSMEGVYSLAKDGNAMAQGAKVYWDESAAELTETAADNIPAGYVFKAALAGDDNVDVKLDHGFEQAALVAFSAGANLVGVDGTGSNAAPLAGTETRLDSLDTAVAAILAALKGAGLMKNS